MPKRFNTTGLCVPTKHYMVDLSERLAQIRELVDDGCYFMINRARQYGKTTTLAALEKILNKDYFVVSMDFQALGNSSFKDENTFSLTFADFFLDTIQQNDDFEKMADVLHDLTDVVMERDSDFGLYKLFKCLKAICTASLKPIVLMIDEVDSATNNQVFLDFLAQLRYYYLKRNMATLSTFQSVILAGVYDVKNLKRKIRPDEVHKVNSPWNIATDFNIDMNFGKDEIAQMLAEYESDYGVGMDVNEMAEFLYDYTSGYPFLVSRLCQLMDERIAGSEEFPQKSDAWTKQGFLEAVSELLSEKNTLFESLMNKLEDYPELKSIMHALLFQGKPISYNPDNNVIGVALMFGFVRVEKQGVVIANRIFETRLYNLFLTATKIQNSEIYTVASREKNQFIQKGHLNMKHVLERFVVHFHDLYGDKDEKFLEEDGRRFFLLYLRPIINGIGNYYIESQTRDMERTDVIVDYNGEQFVIEMKIWRGDAYNARGEAQLANYLEYYHLEKGYMLSFNFNKSKQIGIKEIMMDGKVLVEAVV